MMCPGCRLVKGNPDGVILPLICVLLQTGSPDGANLLLIAVVVKQDIQRTFLILFLLQSCQRLFRIIVFGV